MFSFGKEASGEGHCVCADGDVGFDIVARIRLRLMGWWLEERFVLDGKRTGDGERSGGEGDGPSWRRGILLFRGGDGHSFWGLF